MYMGKTAQVMSLGKAYQQCLKNKANKAELTDWFTTSSKTRYAQELKETLYWILET